MSLGTIEKKALSLLSALERAGKSVSSVAVEGRRIEILLSTGEAIDEFDKLEMRHGKA
ncbi:hypothetical protein [Ruegeria sp. PrR005]|uniref:Uncharacterized protein n=1 Tax=Ruegeria sp. PrR005 TaxID=2706882 RepID=A0A6B2NTH6_9RHOB|nr:hypothetical protein [Ruegeria sp. PrR005]NDW47476.1 hypothetical protein [Ruegeria sp. PrR005]